MAGAPAIRRHIWRFVWPRSSCSSRTSVRRRVAWGWPAGWLRASRANSPRSVALRSRVPDLPQSRTFGLDSSTERRSHVGHSHVCDSSPRRAVRLLRCDDSLRAADHARSPDYQAFSPIDYLDSRRSMPLRYRCATTVSTSVHQNSRNGKRIGFACLSRKQVKCLSCFFSFLSFLLSSLINL